MGGGQRMAGGGGPIRFWSGAARPCRSVTKSDGLPSTINLQTLGSGKFPANRKRSSSVSMTSDHDEERPP